MSSAMLLVGLGWITLAAASSAVAMLLRRAGAPGSAILGGVAVGALLGVTIAGRVWPNLHEQVWSGGAAARLAREQLLHDHELDAFAADSLGMSGADREALRQAQAAQRRVADVSWQSARWDHQRPSRAVVLVLAALTLAFAGSHALTRPSGHRHSAAALASIAGWSVAVPGVTTWLVFDRVLGLDPVAALLAAAATAAGPLGLTSFDRRVADDVEIGGAHFVRTAGRLATLAAILGASIALVLGRHWHAVGIVVTLWVAPLAWMLTATTRRFGGALADRVIVPSLAAAAMLPVDLIGDASLWPIVVGLLVSGDGRWIGAMLGAVLPGGRRWLRSMRLTMGSMNAAPAQLAIVAIGVHLWLIPGEIGLALVMGAVLIAIAVPLRRWMATQLEP